MNNTCLNNKVLPYEPGYCDCCFSENMNVMVCPSNNKCEYAMCEKCIKNLENKTKTNKCPACREESYLEVSTVSTPRREVFHIQERKVPHQGTTCLQASSRSFHLP